MQLFGLLDQPEPENGMCNGDEVHGSLTNVFAMKEGDAVFRDHIVDIATGERDARPLLQERHNPGDKAAFWGCAACPARARHMLPGSGWQSKDALSAWRKHRSPHKVSLSPNAAVEAMSQRLGGGLAGEIDLQGAVDSDHPVVLGDDEGIVGVVDAPELHPGIAPQKIVGLTAAHAECGNAPLWIDALLAIVDNSFLHECGDAIAQQFGMHSQMLLCLKAGENGIGNASISHLDGRAVLNDAGYVSPDLLGNFTRNWIDIFQQRLVLRNQVVYVVNANPAVPADRGHAGIGLSDDQSCFFHCRPDDVHAYSKVHVAFPIRKRRLDKGHVQGNSFRADKSGKSREKYGCVVRTGLIYGISGAVSNEEGVEPKVIAKLLVRVRRHAQGDDVDKLGIHK
ncbi:Uncharacterised protein [uncultured archaeon]|nr:Uncharacterised protein [uncultured archaeon]